MRLGRSARRLARSPQLKGFLSMSGGALIAQVVALASLPLVSRLYSPTEYGILTLVIAISSAISPALCLKFDSVVLLTRSKRQTRVAVSVAISANIAISAVWALFSEFFAKMAFPGVFVPFLPLWVLGTSVLTGLFTLLSQLAVREGRYGSVGARTIYQAVTTAGLQVGLGSAAWSHTGLLTGMLLGKAAGIVGLAKQSYRYIGRHKPSEVKPLLADHWRFPVVFAPSGLLNSVALQLPVLVLAAIYGIDFAGQLGMAERIVGIPLTLVGAATGQVFMGELARLKRAGEKRYFALFARVSVTLSLISIIAFGGLALTADWLIPLALGQDWEAAILLVQILSLTGMLRLVSTPVLSTFSIFQRACANMAMDAVRISLSVSAVCVVALGDIPSDTAVWLLYGALSVVYVVSWSYVFVLLKKESR